MARLQDYPIVTPNTANDNLLIVQSAGQGNAKIDTIGQKIATDTTHSGLTTTSKKLVGAINELNSGKADKSVLSSLIALSSKSGSIASFSTDVADRLYSCKANIVAQQASGTPSPSNPLPITGFSSVNVKENNGNFFDIEAWLTACGVTFTKSGNSYSFTPNSSLYSNPYKFSERDINVSASVTAFTFNGTNLRLDFLNKNDESQTVITSGNLVRTNFNACKVRLNWSTMGTSVTIEKPMINLGAAATAYTAYTGTTTPVSLGQTIYGGTAELVGGNGYLTHICLKFSDFDFSNSNPSSHVFRGDYSGSFYSNLKFPPNSSTPTTAITEHYEAMAWQPISSSDNGKFAVNDYNTLARFVFIDFNYSTQADFEAARNNDKIIVPLKNPIPITFTGANVYSKSGLNNVFADSGDIDLKYLETIGNKFNS